MTPINWMLGSTPILILIDKQIGQSSSSQYKLTVAPSSDQGPEVDLSVGASQVNILSYMSHHYGFVAPLPIPVTDPIPVTSKDWDECLKSVSLQTGTHNPPLPGLTGPIVDFIKYLQRDGPLTNEWDISPGNRQSLSHEVIAQWIHRLNNGLFFINNGDLTDWQIAVITSANALYTLQHILHSSEKPSSVTLT